MESPRCPHTWVAKHPVNFPQFRLRVEDEIDVARTPPVYQKVVFKRERLMVPNVINCMLLEIYV